MIRVSIVSCLLLFISCKKDNNYSFSIQGKWQLTEVYNGHIAWGGCNCWEPASAGIGHSVSFNSNGTYKIIPPALSSASVCTGNYERKDDSTIVWGRCGADNYEAKVSMSGPFLLIEERLFAGLYIYKYKRVR